MLCLVRFLIMMLANAAVFRQIELSDSRVNMTVEIIRNREIEEAENTSTGVVTFEYQFPADHDQIAINRRLLGLDGGELAALSKKEMGIIATDLRQKGFLTNNEIMNLGGALIKKKNE